jgi:chromosome segregation protein
VYLKRLAVQGFKSFPERTTFEFGPGITAIVGPNGSGKSNVADAIRWVLGEQSFRLLRARKAEDVIFAGAGSRSAVGMAEAILTLDNEDRWLPIDFAEVELGRRVYRSGESEYLLNGSRVRLRDLSELLMKADVGQNSYTIMGQGLVDEVLSMAPDQRRMFLDEAADVKRFRMKITEALRRLEATRDNIARVDVVLGELKPRLSQLERQAGRAAEHAAFSAELTEFLRLYYGQRWAQVQNALVRARAELDQHVEANHGAEARVAQLREQMTALGEEIRRRREAISRRDTQANDFARRLAGLEQNLDLDRERHAIITARREETRLELEALESERLSLSTTDVDEGRRGLEVGEQAGVAKDALGLARRQLDEAERSYGTARARVQELREVTEADIRKLGQYQAEIEAGTRRVAELEHEREQSEARRKQSLVELIGYGRRFKDLQASINAADEALAQSRNEADQSRLRLQRVQDEVRRYETAGNDDLRELDRLEGRLDALRRVQAEHDGVALGTRQTLIMGQALLDDVAPGSLGEAPEVEGVIGLLARQIRVPAGLETAINAALENRLHAVIVRDESQVLKAIALLRQRGQGRAQFLPLNSLRHVYPLNLQKERGVVGVASKLVRCDNEHRNLVDTLLGRIIVVDDLEAAMRMIGRSLGSVVTVDGTFIEPTGAISGGASGAQEGVFSRQRELEELPERIAELTERTRKSDERLESARGSLEQIATAARAADDQYDNLRKSGDSSRVDMEKERQRLHRVRRDLDTLRARHAAIDRDVADFDARVAQARAAMEQLEAHRTGQRESLECGESDVALATESRESAIRAVAEASGRLAAAEGEHKALAMLREQHEKAIDRIGSQIEARKMQARNFELEANAMSERMARLQSQLEGLRVEQAHATDDVAPDLDELHRLESHERQVQDDLTGSHSALLATERARLDAEATVERCQERIDALRSEMAREGLGPDPGGEIAMLPDVSEPTETLPGEPVAPTRQVRGGAELDLDALLARIEELRRQIRRLGPINEEAPGDYEESKERYEFLTGQLVDLNEAETQLRSAIDELHGEIKTRFDAAFVTVNEAFGSYFSAFFGGGKASLMLTDPDVPADSGIDIMAQPPGKKIESLSLLSGGERSLTAVALLFALLAANPAPFCVLDEVDAALDEANVGRFAESLKGLAEKTQFITVTHNRRTVESADAIYGVSMAKDGVSQVLSLKLADLPTG